MAYALDVQKFLDRAEALFPKGTMFMIAVPQPAARDGQADGHKVHIQGGGDGGTALCMLAAIQSTVNRTVSNTAMAMASDPVLGMTEVQVHEAFQQLVDTIASDTEQESAGSAAVSSTPPPDAVMKLPNKKKTGLRLLDAAGLPVDRADQIIRPRHN